METAAATSSSSTCTTSSTTTLPDEDLLLRCFESEFLWVCHCLNYKLNQDCRYTCVLNYYDATPTIKARIETFLDNMTTRVVTYFEAADPTVDINSRPSFRSCVNVVLGKLEFDLTRPKLWMAPMPQPPMTIWAVRHQLGLISAPPPIFLPSIDGSGTSVIAPHGLVLQINTKGARARIVLPSSMRVSELEDLFIEMFSVDIVGHSHLFVRWAFHLPKAFQPTLSMLKSIEREQRDNPSPTDPKIPYMEVILTFHSTMDMGCFGSMSSQGLPAEGRRVSFRTRARATSYDSGDSSCSDDLNPDCSPPDCAKALEWQAPFVGLMEDTYVDCDSRSFFENSDRWSVFNTPEHFQYYMKRHMTRWTLGRALSPLARNFNNDVKIIFGSSGNNTELNIVVCDLVPLDDYVYLPFVIAGSGKIRPNDATHVRPVSASRLNKKFKTAKS